MPWRESLEPVRMERVALVVPRVDLRGLLVRVADQGTVELDRVSGTGEGVPGPAGRRLQQLSGDRATPPLLAPDEVDPDALARAGRADLLAGEAELEECAAGAAVRGEVAALAGWMTAGELPALRERLAEIGGAVQRLRRPRGVDPPTLLRGGSEVRRSLRPLVDTYATVPYADVDPTLMASLAYVVMFGMMFGDAGHGLLLVLAGLALRAGHPRRLSGVRRAWPFLVGAGLAATVFGLLYGEFFGPTGVVPPLWLAPLEEPVPLLVAAIGVGAVLLAGAYALGTVNRRREGGWPLALYAPSGIAGVALFLGLGAVVLGSGPGPPWLLLLGAAVWLAGSALAFIGFLVNAGGGGSGVTQAVVELFDAAVRAGSNLVSFARLAAFGLMHAAIGALVWRGATALADNDPVPLAWLGAVAVFALGTALAFSLEALVAGVQALRLEYYELFSRVFQAEGRPFRPWHVPTAAPAAPGERAALTSSGSAS
jgi:V/A-type H+-transporting ATPase subunit I